MSELKVIIDTREQTPFVFEGLPIRGYKSIPTETRTLKTGDYTIEGFENEFVIERKSISDLCGTLTGGHARFLKEMERIRNFKMPYIIIEGQPIDVFAHCWKYGMKDGVNVIIQSLVAYAYHYRVRVRFCKDRKAATEYAARKIIEFYEQNKKEGNVKPEEKPTKDPS